MSVPVALSTPPGASTGFPFSWELVSSLGVAGGTGTRCSDHRVMPLGLAPPCARGGTHTI